MRIIIARPASRAFFPLDEQLRLFAKNWSEQVAKEAVFLSGLLPYAQVAEVLGRVGDVALSASTAWRLVQTWGAQMKAVEQRQEVKAYEIIEPKPQDPNRSKNKMGVGLDGTMVHIREEGWKELKVGAVFEVGRRTEKDPETQEMVALGSAKENSYVAHLGGPAPFGRRLWAEARQRQWMAAQDSQAIGDGAAWIWNLVSEHFYNSHQTVDWYHATEHLAAVAHTLYGEGNAKARRWYQNWQTNLYQGHVRRLVQALKRLAKTHPAQAAFLLQEAGYFKKHQKRMNYLEMRIDGFLIGSGMVESAAKQYKARFCGPGMRWSRKGAERLLPIRTAILSKRFDKMWQLAYFSPPT